jgi:hypothetical protein
MLHFTERSPGTEHLRSQISNLRSLAESCSRQIRGWADNLQNSDIKGQRHLNDESRRRYEEQKRADAFERRLNETLRRLRPQDYADPDGL